MAKEYKRTKSSTRGLQHFLSLGVTFILGYFTANMMSLDNLSQWLSKHLAAQHVAATEHPPTSPKAAAPGKAKFEFYTLLTHEKSAKAPPTTHSFANMPNKSVNVGIQNAAQHAVATTAATHDNRTQQILTAVENKSAPLTQIKGNFSVQVASFKARQDAEHMKGLLTLKGFNVAIVPVNHATKGNWFRVVVGPFANRALAQKAQLDLAKNERLNGMITAG